ncbi:chemotaxis protein CheR [Ramlibacter humi]|uniref:Chemotaxis protein CheR n=2 Tax=Ramlibacter humi TaxID=2530451 RepID=A0A4Z0CC70_9BURK|nr:chemotaxis protein CheR [Ramlibacter humi]
MGLHFPPERFPQLHRGIEAAARERQQDDVPRYVRGLLDTGIGHAEVQRLAAHLTVGETYFFRDPPLLDAVAGMVLPEMVRARRGRDQHLRVWSAGCASGEEAYTLAILLHEALPDPRGWRVSITGTDIHPAALEKARAGVYGEWSFRSTPARLKAAYFLPRADGRHEIAPHLRRLVDFRWLNLAEDSFPSSDGGTDAVDILFCRNVLMYFRPERARATVARLRRSLADGGCLVVGPSEASQALFSRLAVENHPGAILYRKRSAPRRAEVAVAPCAPVRPPARAPVPACAPAAPSRSCLAAAPDEPAALARSMADRGDLGAALQWCERWIDADKVNPAAHYLRAMVLLERGEAEAARLALRRAVFLEPGFVLAHFALGNLARQAGETAAAARHYANARVQLARYQPGDLLPEGDGLSAGRLTQLLSGLAPADAA